MNRDRPSALLEAIANLQSRMLVSLIIAGTSLGAAGATTVLSLAEVEGVLEQQQELVDRGQYVFQVAEEKRRPFSGRRCDAMNSTDGVVAAGGMSSSRPVDIMFDQESNYNVVSVTAGFARVIWPDTPPLVNAGTVVGSSVAERFGLSNGAHVAFTSGSVIDEVVPVSAIASASARDRRYDSRIAIISPPSEDVVLCLVEATPGAQDGVGAVLEDTFRNDAGFIVLPLVVPDTVSRTPQEQLENRITRWTPVASGLLAIALLLGSWQARSGEFALYRHLGFSRAFVLRLLLVETLYLVWLPIASGVSAMLVIAPPSDALVVELVVPDLASLILLTVALIPMGVALLALRSPARMLKDVV